jgi:hypothetical protein
LSQGTLLRLSNVEQLLSRWWPSRRLESDPLELVRVEGRYAPVTIANWKLTPWMRRAILKQRVVQPLGFTAGRLTIVIPFRDREEHLRRLLPPLIDVLERQQIQHQILIVEQVVPGLFNRGRLLNIGMHHAAEQSDYYCLHDVDAIPVHANYGCPSQPFRLVNAIVRPEGETRRSPHYFSGAVSVRKEQAFAANGFSNLYWGWGKEDDDFFFRLLLAGFLCYVDTEGRYLDLPNPCVVKTTTASKLRHTQENRKRRSQLVRGCLDPLEDGLNTVKYEVVERIDFTQYIKIRVRWD